MTAVLMLTASFTVAEIVGGLLTGSLALLADAGHMLSDNLSLAFALFAAWLAGQAWCDGRAGMCGASVTSEPRSWPHSSTG